jgi:hypothetical protein
MHSNEFSFLTSDLYIAMSDRVSRQLAPHTYHLGRVAEVRHTFYFL